MMKLPKVSPHPLMNKKVILAPDQHNQPPDLCFGFHLYGSTIYVENCSPWSHKARSKYPFFTALRQRLVLMMVTNAICLDDIAPNIIWVAALHTTSGQFRRMYQPKVCQVLYLRLPWLA
jgi:hypothetical protein